MSKTILMNCVFVIVCALAVLAGHQLAPAQSGTNSTCGGLTDCSGVNPYVPNGAYDIGCGSGVGCNFTMGTQAKWCVWGTPVCRKPGNNDGPWPCSGFCPSPNNQTPCNFSFPGCS